jgi:hypothetical protein
VLRANVPLPLIRASKRALAPIKIEDADKRPGVCAYDVASEYSYTFKGSLIAGLAGNLSSDFDCQRTLCHYFRLVALVSAD